MSAVKALENATSLERFLNRHVLFVQGIDQNVPKNEVVQALSQVCKQPQQGRIDILTTQDGKMRGTAFLNFHNAEDARASLEKWRFALKVQGKPLKMQFSSDREFKDMIQGPAVAKFKCLIRNVPEDLAPEALFERLSDFGEIIQLHTACDHYGQHYAIIQYLELSSVQAAIRQMHRAKVLSHVLLVEQYKPNATYGVLPRNINQSGAQPQLAVGTAAPPAAAIATSSGGGTSTYRSGGSGSPGVLPGTTYAALQQQQQEREMIEQEGYSYSERYSDSGGGITASPAGPGINNSNGAAVPADTGLPLAAAPVAQTASLAVANFFAAASGPAHAPTAPGSLATLLSTALRHVHALEEHLCCPITTDPLVDPVVAADGNTYERLAITAWLEDHNTSPLTNEVLAHKMLAPNKLIKKIAEELRGISHRSADSGAEGGPQHGSPVALAGAASDFFDGSGALPAAAGVMDGGMAPVGLQDAHVPVPVPVPVSVSPINLPYQHPVHHGMQQQEQSPNSGAHTHHHIPGAPPPPPPPQLQHQQQQQPTHHQQQTQQQQHRTQQPLQMQYGNAEMPTVMRPQIMPAPVAFVHVPQPQQQPFQMQGTTYYAYRPMGM